MYSIIQSCKEAYATYATRKLNLVIATYGAIIFTNKVLMRNYPKYPSWRFTIFSFKYVILPALSFRFIGNAITWNQQALFDAMLKKYSFGYTEYNR
jgi:hypothetical protein